MLRVSVLLMVTLVGFAGEAKAQWLGPFAPPVIVSPEEWRQVTFEGTVSYCLDGRTHYATDKGPHWQTGGPVTAQCANTFVEPFDCFGNRIPKPVIPVVGAEGSFKSGVKTYWIANGTTYFQSWVSRNGEVVQVLVKIEKVVTAPADVLTPDSPMIEPSPLDLIPQAQ
jgi:hypothetical protein